MYDNSIYFFGNLLLLLSLILLLKFNLKHSIEGVFLNLYFKFISFKSFFYLSILFVFLAIFWSMFPFLFYSLLIFGFLISSREIKENVFSFKGFIFFFFLFLQHNFIFVLLLLGYLINLVNQDLFVGFLNYLLIDILSLDPLFVIKPVNKPSMEIINKPVWNQNDYQKLKQAFKLEIFSHDGVFTKKLPIFLKLHKEILEPVGQNRILSAQTKSLLIAHGLYDIKTIKPTLLPTYFDTSILKYNKVTFKLYSTELSGLITEDMPKIKDYHNAPIIVKAWHAAIIENIIKEKNVMFTELANLYGQFFIHKYSKEILGLPGDIVILANVSDKVIKQIPDKLLYQENFNPQGPNEVFTCIRPKSSELNALCAIQKSFGNTKIEELVISRQDSGTTIDFPAYDIFQNGEKVNIEVKAINTVKHNDKLVDEEDGLKTFLEKYLNKDTKTARNLQRVNTQEANGLDFMLLLDITDIRTYVEDKENLLENSAKIIEKLQGSPSHAYLFEERRLALTDGNQIIEIKKLNK